MTDNRLICMIPTKQLTRGSRYRIIKPKKIDGKIVKVQVQADNGNYLWFNRNKFVTRGELEGMECII